MNMSSTIMNLVNQLKSRDKENFHSLGKALGIKIQKGIQKTISRNGYIRMDVDCSKGDFESIKSFCETKQWIPKLKTANCDRSTHLKICSQNELEKFIPSAFKGKTVMYNSCIMQNAIGKVLCSPERPFFFCYNNKLDCMVAFFTFHVYWEVYRLKINQAVNYSRGSRKTEME